MNPASLFTHENQLYLFQAKLLHDSLTLKLISKPSLKEWKGVFKYNDLPLGIKNSASTLEEVFFLFEEKENFVVQNTTGIVSILIKEIIKNKFVETPVHLKLNLLCGQVDLSSSEIVAQLKGLKNTVEFLQNKVNKIQRIIEPEFVGLNAEFEKMEVIVPEKKQKMKTLEERVKAVEKEITIMRRKVEEGEEEIREMKEMKDKGEGLQENRIPSILNLNFQQLGDKGIQYLTKKKWTSNLSKLVIHSNNITPVGVATLSNGDWEKLKVLDLSGNPIGDQAIQYLKAFELLEELGLGDCNITAKGVQILSEIRLLLKKLYLSYNSIGNSGVQFLEVFQKLTLLHLYDNRITGQGVMRLSQMKWEELKYLNLEYNDIGGEGKVILGRWAQKQKNLRLLY